MSRSIKDPQQSTRGAVMLGTYPTPALACPSLDTEHGQLFVKNDGLANAHYGGNKVRKLEPILERALARGAKRLVTLGAAGSHQVLATAYFARTLGLETAAVLCPRPWSTQAEAVLRATCALGAEIHTVNHGWQLPLVAPTLLRPKDHLVPAGGTNVASTRRYLAAAMELHEQIEAGVVAKPDVMVVALGTGGTAAGLLAGIAELGLDTTLLAVKIVELAAIRPSSLVAMAYRALPSRKVSLLPELQERLVVEHGFLGRGYGCPTREAEIASEVAQSAGLGLDLTYTAKAFAAALALIRHPSLSAVPRKLAATSITLPPGRPLRVLYWHTLSAAPMAPLLQGAPSTLPDKLNRLLIAG